MGTTSGMASDYVRGRDAMQISGQVRSGQVRSGQVRVFNLHIQSKHMPVMGTDTGLRRFLCLGQKANIRSGQVRVFNMHIQSKLL